MFEGGVNDKQHNDRGGESGQNAQGETGDILCRFPLDRQPDDAQQTDQRQGGNHASIDRESPCQFRYDANDCCRA